MDGSDVFSHEEARGVLAGGYLHGACSAFAIAVHRRTGWPLLALWDGEELLHSGCRHPDGGVVDARGIVDEANFAAPFGGGEIRECDEAAMLAAHPQTEEQIAQATLRSELMLILPGVSVDRQRFVAFTDELHALCKRHGIYLRGDMPSGRGMIAYYAYGNEDGFDICLMPTGGAAVTRRLGADNEGY